MNTRAIRDVIVVLPAYEEAENLPSLLDGLAAAFAQLGRSYRIVVVDDGSRDATAVILAEARARLPLEVVTHAVNQGLGTTLRDGLVAALATAGSDDAILTMDADDTHPPEQAGMMLARLEAGADLVIASRYVPGARIVGLSWPRRLLSTMASWVFRALYPIPGARDYTCGFRLYRAPILHAALARHGEGLIRERGFTCMAELLLRLAEQPLVVAEVPLVLRYDRKGGASKMRVGRTIARTLALLWRHRRQRR